MAFALFCSFATETVQYIKKVGYFEIDDIINNTLGAGIGYLIYRIIYVLALQLLHSMTDE